MSQPTYSSSRSTRPAAQPLQTRNTSSLRRSSLFKPPQSPATPDRRQSHAPHYASATTTSRKRARRDSSHAPVATPLSTSSSTWALPSVESSIARSDFASPEPFVNTRYDLAGGLDTPRLARSSYFERSDHEDLGVRRRWRTSDGGQEIGEQQHALGSDRNGTARYPASPNSSATWTSFVAAVAGKVWSLGTSAFQGFYAGGGQGYKLEAPDDGDGPTRVHESMWASLHDPRFDRSATPVPGSFPQDDEEGEYGSSRPTKRQHTESGSPWVMVANPMDSENNPLRLAVKTPRHTRPSTSSRQSLIPVSRRTPGGLTSGSPAVHYARPASYAHQRASSDVTPVAKQSPLSPEAQKFILDRRREDKQADASIRRLNDQLKAMIKEGKDALGTKVEVTDDDGMDLVDDEGYFEEPR